jgi:xanthine dehydrogenase accessory factor
VPREHGVDATFGRIVSTISSVDEALLTGETWRRAGEDVALATVVATRHSTPRPPGTKLVVTASGRLFGSVSGGCVEADVAERAKRVLVSGTPELVTYGLTDDEGWEVGLPCGGEIDVFIERFPGLPPVETGTSYLVVSGPGAGKRWFHDSHGGPRSMTELRGEIFVEVISRPPKVVVVGAVDIAEAICRLCAAVGWRSVVVDPREGFARPERVPSADELLTVWPDKAPVDLNTAFVSLVTEEHIDLLGLRHAIDAGAFYVGALGSTRVQARRRASLGKGAATVKGPVGLDLGAQTSAEIALEIVAEIVAVYRRAEIATLPGHASSAVSESAPDRSSGVRDLREPAASVSDRLA